MVMTKNLKLIGEGNTAEIYDIGDGKVLKLFRKGIPENIIIAEFNNNVAVSKLLTFVPKAYQMCEIEGKTGIIYEKITGKDFINIILKNLFNLNSMSKQLAYIHKSIQVPCCEDIISLKEKLAQNINLAKDLSDDKKKFVLEYLSKLPDSKILCHMDFHPGNIMIQNGEYIVIDWMNACVGDSCADVMRTCLLLEIGEDLHSPYVIRKIISLFQNHMKKVYIKEYLKISGKSYENIKVWELPIAAARLVEWLSPNEKKKLLEIVDKSYSKYIS